MPTRSGQLPVDTQEHEQQTATNAMSPHVLEEVVVLSKHGPGLKLIPEFSGSNWENFKRKLETQFIVMGLDSFLEYKPSVGNPVEMRNDTLASAQILMRLSQAQYKQVSNCSSTTELGKDSPKFTRKQRVLRHRRTFWSSFTIRKTQHNPEADQYSHGMRER